MDAIKNRSLCGINTCSKLMIVLAKVERLLYTEVDVSYPVLRACVFDVFTPHHIILLFTITLFRSDTNLGRGKQSNASEL